MKMELPMGLRFSLLSRAFKRQLDARLREHGLTGVQLGVLGQLDRLKDSGMTEINQKALEKATRVTHPTMTEILKRLERAGFISCEPGKTDRRSKIIRPTEKARVFQAELEQADRCVSLQLCKGLSPEQLQTLTEITDIMLKNAFEGCKEGEDIS